MPTLESIDRKLDQLLKQRSKKTWVSVGIITDITGWDKEYMRKARENGLVKFKNEDGSFKYLLESIPEIFINKKAVAN